MEAKHLLNNYKMIQSRNLNTFVALILMASSLFGQKVTIKGDATISGKVEVMDSIIFADGTKLATASLNVLHDADNDTKILVEDKPDEDRIRFHLNDTEYMRLDASNLRLNFRNSIYIGNGAGLDDDGNNFNIGLGSGAGGNIVSGQHNTIIGNGAAGNLVTGSNNVIIGNEAASEEDGSNNTFIGKSAGFGNGGSGNVFLGYQAGHNTSGSNQLVIDNSNTQTPLLYGHFDNDKLAINGSQMIGSANLTIHDLDGGFGGLYVNTTSAGLPFYGYAQGGTVKGYHYFDQDKWIFYKSGTAMVLDDSNQLGIGVGEPETKLHVRGLNNIGHIMKIENLSQHPSADGLEIKINRAVTGLENNYITFSDANSIAGRIEGFALGEGPNFTDFPGINFSAYFDINAMINAVFTPGSFPTLNPGSWPTLNRGTLPSLSGGSFGSLSFNVDFDELAYNLSCQANPFCNNYHAWISGGINGASFPTLNQGSLPSLSGGSWPTLTGGTLPQFNIYGLINPEIQATAYADMAAIANWAFENGIEALSADPFRLKLMGDPDYWSNIASRKHGGVTYGSKGADYAEWLERENPNEQIKAGQIVGVKNGKISLNTENADQIMVISVMPVVLGNLPDSTRQEDFEKVAFIGQSPVWVVGEVESGDYIIASGQHDGYGLAISAEELTIDQVSQVVGRAWESGDKIINLVNMVVGLKTNEMATILGSISKEMKTMDKRLSSIESMLNLKDLAIKN